MSEVAVSPTFRTYVRWSRRAAALFILALASYAQLRAQPFAYVTNELSNSVSVIDLSTNVVVKTVAVGIRPVSVAISPDGKRAYVVNQPGDFASGIPGSVSVIDTASNKVVATIPVGRVPNYVAIAPDGKHAYVLHQGALPMAASLLAIDTSTNTISAIIPLNSEPAYQVALSPDGLFAYMANVTSVDVVSTVTNSLVKSIDLGFASSVGVAVHPDGSRVYATLTDNSLAVINTETKTITTTISLPPLTNTSLVVSPDGKFLYVLDPRIMIPGFQGLVSVIDTVSNRIINTLTAGMSPQALAISPDGKHLYIPNSGSFQQPGTVLVIDVVSRNIVQGIAVGELPIALAITPATSSTTGTINVTTNLAAATFTIAGPVTYSGSGTSFSQTNAPTGTYTISYGAVSGFATPPQQTLTLSAGATIAFTGAYQSTTTTPTLKLTLDQPVTQPSPAFSVRYLDTATVTLTDQNGVAMQSQAVRFQVPTLDVGVAGHAHTNFTSNLFSYFVDDSGLTATQCITDSSGQCHLNYVVPEVSGEYNVTASFQSVTSLPQAVKVQVSGLVGVGSGVGFDSTPGVGGQTPEHPTNHFGTPVLAGTLVPSIGAGYIKATRGGTLGINDMSLPLGGLFDLDKNWDNVGGHNLHRQGLSVDINRTQVDGTLVDVRTLLRLVRAINAVPILEHTPNCLGKYPFTPCIHIEVSP